MRWLFLEEIQANRFDVLQSLYDEVCVPFQSVLPLYSSKFDEIDEYGQKIFVEEWIRKNPERNQELSPFL